MSSPQPSAPTERDRLRSTVEALEVARSQELARLSDEDSWQIIQSLRLFANGWREDSEGSGLVEQQRLFMKYRNP